MAPAARRAQAPKGKATHGSRIKAHRGHHGRIYPFLVVSLLFGAPSVFFMGCAGFPRDGHGTTDHIRATGVLNVGASSTDAAMTALEARERRLVDRVAKRLGARAEWRYGNAHALLGELAEHKLALVAATVPCDSPFGDQVALSQPYLVGGPAHHSYCLAVGPGENELLLLVDQLIVETREGSQP